MDLGIDAIPLQHPPRCESPPVAKTSITPPPTSRILTSKVPPPRSKTCEQPAHFSNHPSSTLFELIRTMTVLSSRTSIPYASAAATGSLWWHAEYRSEGRP